MLVFAAPSPPCICPGADHCTYQHRDKNYLMTPHSEKVLDILLIVKQEWRKTPISGHDISWMSSSCHLCTSLTTQPPHYDSWIIVTEISDWPHPIISLAVHYCAWLSPPPQVSQYWWMLSSPAHGRTPRSWDTGTAASSDSLDLRTQRGVMNNATTGAGERGPLTGSPGGLVLVVRALCSESHVLSLMMFTLSWHPDHLFAGPDVTWANEGIIEMTNSYLITKCRVPGVDILTAAWSHVPWPGVTPHYSELSLRHSVLSVTRLSDEARP